MPVHRPRLRLNKSCQGCRQHKKKCDGKRPQCGPCLRRGYVCSWTDTTVSRLLGPGPSPKVSDLTDEYTARIDPNLDPSVSSDRTLDALPPTSSSSKLNTEIPPVAESESRGEFNFPDVADRYGFGERSLASTTDFGNHFDEHIIISGVLHGWDHVKSRFLLDPQWPAIILLDHEMIKLGYTVVHRMAALWFSRMKMKVIASIAFGLDNEVPLPKWAVADVHVQMHGKPLVNYLPWPSIRRAAMSDSQRFWTPTTTHDFLQNGARFMWPSEINTAYTTTTANSMCKFTPEFMLRVTNLRSWTLTKGYLDAHPELRGLAPQLEPSATTRKVSSRAELEALYWQMLRRKYEPFLKQKSGDSLRLFAVESSWIPTGSLRKSAFKLNEEANVLNLVLHMRPPESGIGTVSTTVSSASVVCTRFWKSIVSAGTR